MKRKAEEQMSVLRKMSKKIQVDFHFCSLFFFFFSFLSN